MSTYLDQILQKYLVRDVTRYSSSVNQLKSTLATWAGSCYIDILDSGSRAKGTAINLASDVDYLVSLSNGCNQNQGGLEYTFNQLFNHLVGKGYQNVRKQNVSCRVTLSSLEIDITPATKQPGYSNDHSVWLSKKRTWQKTNIQKHISDISRSGRTNEIKIIKIWRELNRLDFPSIYLEYLALDILSGRPTSITNLGQNAFYIFTELAKDYGNPLFSTIIDPANTGNTLSDLLDRSEKNLIISAAKNAARQANWSQIVK